MTIDSRSPPSCVIRTLGVSDALKAHIVKRVALSAPPMPPAGFAAYKRTYARRIADLNPDAVASGVDPNATEEWHETLARVVTACVRQLRTPLSDAEQCALFDLMYDLKGLVAGRMLCQLGTSTVDRFGFIALQNCAVVPILPEGLVERLCWVFHSLMFGVGVGFNIEEGNFHRFPKPRHVSIVRLDTNDADFIVPDSREGWVYLLERLLRAHLDNTGPAFFTFSTLLVRPRGAIIHGFGGEAAGPEPLCAGIAAINAIMNARARTLEGIRPIDMLDIINIIGRIVQEGGVRRSAELAAGSASDVRFLRAKRWDLSAIDTQTLLLVAYSVAVEALGTTDAVARTAEALLKGCILTPEAAAAMGVPLAADAKISRASRMRFEMDPPPKLAARLVQRAEPNWGGVVDYDNCTKGPEPAQLESSTDGEVTATQTKTLCGIQEHFTREMQARLVREMRSVRDIQRVWIGRMEAEDVPKFPKCTAYLENERLLATCPDCDASYVFPRQWNGLCPACGCVMCWELSHCVCGKRVPPSAKTPSQVEWPKQCQFCNRSRYIVPQDTLRPRPGASGPISMCNAVIECPHCARHIDQDGTVEVCPGCSGAVRGVRLAWEEEAALAVRWHSKKKAETMINFCATFIPQSFIEDYMVLRTVPLPELAGCGVLRESLPHDELSELRTYNARAVDEDYFGDKTIWTHAPLQTVAYVLLPGMGGVVIHAWRNVDNNHIFVVSKVQPGTETGDPQLKMKDYSPYDQPFYFVVPERIRGRKIVLPIRCLLDCVKLPKCTDNAPQKDGAKREAGVLLELINNRRVSLEDFRMSVDPDIVQARSAFVADYPFTWMTLLRDSRTIPPAPVSVSASKHIKEHAAVCAVATSLETVSGSGVDATCKTQKVPSAPMTLSPDSTREAARVELARKLVLHARRKLREEHAIVAEMIEEGVRERLRYMADEPARRAELLTSRERWTQFVEGMRYVPAWRSNSNNSVIVDDVAQLPEEVWEAFSGSGEPMGLLNRRLARECGRIGDRRYPDPNVVSTNPCAEQWLEPYETCCLMEFWLHLMDSEEELWQAVRLLYLVAKHSLALPCPALPPTQAVVNRNMRMGIACGAYAAANEEQRSWLPRVYERLRAFDVEHSGRVGFPISIKLTTVKPSGTQSLLGGYPAGCHAALAQHVIRRIRFCARSDLARFYMEAGFKWEHDVNFDGSKRPETVVIDFPMEYPEGTMLASQMSAVQQLEVVKRLQTDWSDNAVSCTIYYKREEVPAIRAWLIANYFSCIKSISFSMLNDEAYPLCPLEPITKKEYKRLVARLPDIRGGTFGIRVTREEEKLELFSNNGGASTGASNGADKKKGGDRDCPTGVCPLK